jgi:hypothetical protein
MPLAQAEHAKQAFCSEARTTMNLFEIIPANFFSPLVSSNREIYADALLLLHERFQFELNIRVDDYISVLIALIEDKNFIPDDDDEEITETALTTTSKARMILNRLVKTGWVDKEFMDGTFIEIITPRDYAIQVLKLLNELRDHNMREYNSLVFATYSSLKEANNEHREQMYEAVLSAKKNTEQLTYELKTLYHGIRNYLRRIQEQNDVNDLLESQFEKYKRLTDRIYHPIKTMDSVYRYRTPIKQLLSEIRGDEDLLQNMRERAMTVRKYDHDEEAGAEILQAIDFIFEVYNNLDGIINEIDRKHSNYTKSSIEKIKYLMTADQSIQGKLAEILKTYSNACGSDKEAIASMMEKHIRINRQESFDAKSLYHKSVHLRHLDTTPLEIADDRAMTENAMNDLVQQMRNTYTLAQVRAFVNGLFAENVYTITSDNIVINDDSDFILLILAVIRAKERGMNYTVEIGTGSILQNGYQIPNLTIAKQKEKINVE